jgi:hypothetical protein
VILRALIANCRNETFAFNQWARIASPWQPVPSQNLLDYAVTLCEAADALRASVQGAMAAGGAYEAWAMDAGACEDWGSDEDWWSDDGDTSWCSEEQPEGAIWVYNVPVLTEAEVVEHMSWVASSKAVATAEFDYAVAALYSEGQHGLAHTCQHLWERLMSAVTGKDAAVVYMLFVGEWQQMLMRDLQFRRGKNVLRSIMDVLVRLSRTTCGLDDRDAFNAYMKVIFGDWLESERDLPSRLHHAFQIAVRKLVRAHVAFDSSRSVQTALRRGRRTRERRAQPPRSQSSGPWTPTAATQGPASQQVQPQQGLLALQDAQQHETVTEIVTAAPAGQSQQSSWQWLGDANMPPQARP